MDALYPYFLIIHLFCAIIFVGYLFFDVFIMPIVRKKLKQKDSDSVPMLNTISEVISARMPFVILILFITGGLMVGKWFSGIDSFSNLQILLIIKVALALSILLLVIFSLSCYYLFKVRNPIGRFIHPIVLALAVFIVILAKLAFFV